MGEWTGGGQLTTIIVAGVEEMGTSIPLILVRTNGTDEVDWVHVTSSNVMTSLVGMLICVTIAGWLKVVGHGIMFDTARGTSGDMVLFAAGDELTSTGGSVSR
jgi:hypothetical protein